MSEPPVAYDYAGRSYCADCGDSGAWPCRYHAQRKGLLLKEDTTRFDDGICVRCGAGSATPYDGGLYCDGCKARVTHA